MLLRNLTEKELLDEINRIDLQELIQESNYIQQFCENQDRYNLLYRYRYWYHALPLRNEQFSSLNPLNWNLPWKVIKKILKYKSDLEYYAKLIMYLDQHQKPITDYFDSVIEILPPYVVFPLYDSKNKHWKKGLAWIYYDIYYDMAINMSDEEIINYFTEYPEPKYFKN